MTIDVIIPAYGPEALSEVEKLLLPQRTGVRYIVAWQKHLNVAIPDDLKARQDIDIYRSGDVGLSRNRNFGIEKSTADILLFPDSDVVLAPDIFDKVERSFTQWPDTQVATFITHCAIDQYYPSQIETLKFRLPKNYFVKSYDMAIVKEVKNLLRFDERFGINSTRYGCGEDELFHLKARKMGLKCVFFPEVIASHPHMSTGGKEMVSSSLLKGSGAVIAKSFPASWILRVPIKAYRLTKNGQSTFFTALFNLYAGAIESLFLKL